MIRTTFALLLTVLPGVSLAECAVDRLDIRGEFGAARFSVEVADDPAERSQGLMHRQNMPMSAGMLFVYERPQRVAFWMKNTPLPLDLIFIDEAGVVSRIHENAVPFDLTAIEGGDAVQFVLEINGGLAAALGLELGDAVRHPAISAGDAVWSCD